MKKNRKLLSILLTVVLIIGMWTAFPLTAHAATGLATINIGSLGTSDTSNGAIATESQWLYRGSDKVLFINTAGGNYKLQGTNSNL